MGTSEHPQNLVAVSNNLANQSTQSQESIIGINHQGLKKHRPSYKAFWGWLLYVTVCYCYFLLCLPKFLDGWRFGPRWYLQDRMSSGVRRIQQLSDGFRGTSSKWWLERAYGIGIKHKLSQIVIRIKKHKLDHIRITQIIPRKEGKRAEKKERKKERKRKKKKERKKEHLDSK